MKKYLALILACLTTTVFADPVSDWYPAKDGFFNCMKRNNDKADKCRDEWEAYQRADKALVKFNGETMHGVPHDNGTQKQQRR